MEISKYVSITQLTKYIKYIFDQDTHLNTIYLKGEISNFKHHSRGHFYFTLKDEFTRISAVMFSSSASKLKFEPQDGMKVLVTGKVSVYEANGGYQIYVHEMIEDGVGNLYIAFEQLKKKLEQEGLFDPTKKKKIPKIPKTIGIITAPTGAAIRDILSTIKRRWPIAQTILFPSLVQGAEATKDLVRNIEKTVNYPLDVLIIGRGGGSIEDLWCFNEESVARAIYALDVPVISAVGHEVDFTISDFVADLRAPTPTGAAELSVPNLVDVSNYLRQVQIRLQTNIDNLYQQKKEFLNFLLNSSVLRNPISMYEVKEQEFDHLYERLLLSYQKIIEKKEYDLQSIYSALVYQKDHFLMQKKHHYQLLLSKLEILNPLFTIKRGYSIIRKDNAVITSAKKLKKEDAIEIEFQDGKINAVIK